MMDTSNNFKESNKRLSVPLNSSDAGSTTALSPKTLKRAEEHQQGKRVVLKEICLNTFKKLSTSNKVSPMKSGSGQPSGSKTLATPTVKDHETYVNFAREFIEEIVENCPPNSGNDLSSVEHLEKEVNVLHGVEAHSEGSRLSVCSVDSVLPDLLQPEAVYKKQIDTDTDTSITEYESAVESDALDTSSISSSFVTDDISVDVSVGPQNGLEEITEKTLSPGNFNSTYISEALTPKALSFTGARNKEDEDIDAFEDAETSFAECLISSTELQVERPELDISALCFDVQNLCLNTPKLNKFGLKKEVDDIQFSPEILVTLNPNLCEESLETISQESYKSLSESYISEQISLQSISFNESALTALGTNCALLFESEALKDSVDETSAHNFDSVSDIPVTESKLQPTVSSDRNQSVLDNSVFELSHEDQLTVEIDHLSIKNISVNDSSVLLEEKVEFKEPLTSYQDDLEDEPLTEPLLNTTFDLSIQEEKTELSIQDKKTLNTTFELLPQDEKPVNKTVDLSVQEEETVDKTVELPVQEENPVDKTELSVQEEESVDKTVELSVQEEESVNKTVELSVQEDKPVDKTVELPVQEENPVDKTELSVKEEESVNKTVDLSVQEEEPVDKIELSVQEEEPVDKTELSVQEEEPVNKTVDLCVQEEEPVSKTELSIQEEKRLNTTLELLAQEEKPVDETVELSTQEEKALNRTVEIFVQEERPVDTTVELSVQEEEPVNKIVELSVQEEETVNKTVELFVQEEEPVNKAAELSVQEEEPVIKKVELSVQEEEAVNKAVELTVQEEEPVSKTVELSVQEENPINKAVALPAQEEEPRNNTAELSVQEEKPVNKTEVSVQEEKPVDKTVELSAQEENSINKTVALPVHQEEPLNNIVELSVQEEEPVDKTVEEEKPLDTTFKLLVQEKLINLSTSEELSVQEKITSNTFELPVLEEKPIDKTVELLVQEETPADNTAKLLVQEEKAVGTIFELSVQETKSVDKTEELSIREITPVLSVNEENPVGTTIDITLTQPRPANKSVASFYDKVPVILVPEKEIGFIQHKLVTNPAEESLSLNKDSIAGSGLNSELNANNISFNKLIEICKQQQKQLEQIEDQDVKLVEGLKSQLEELIDENKSCSLDLEDILAAEASKISNDIRNASRELDEEDLNDHNGTLVINIKGKMASTQSSRTVDENVNPVPLDVKWLSDSRNSSMNKTVSPQPKSKMTVNNANQEDDPFSPRSRLTSSPPRDGNSSAGGDFQANIYSNKLTDNDHCSFESDAVTAEVNHSEAGPEIAQQAFAEEIFADSAGFDFLSSKGGPATAQSLRLESLYVKFDPLVSAAPVARTDRNIPLPPLFQDSVNNKAVIAPLPPRSNVSQDQDLVHQQPATPKNAAIAFVDRLISLSPSPSKQDRVRSPPPPPVVKKEVVSPPKSILLNANPEEMNEELLILRELLDQQDKAHQETLTQKTEELKALECQIAGLQLQLKAVDEREQQLKKKMAEKSQGQQQMSVIMEEYEKTISRLVAEKEHERQMYEQEKSSLTKEKDVALGHLASIEGAFSDVHQKYERSKLVIDGFKKNEEILRDSLSKYEQMVRKNEQAYAVLKSHATAQLDGANQELENLRRTHAADIAKHKAMLKKAELKSSSLEEMLEQKKKENAELSSICDDLINKVT